MAYVKPARATKPLSLLSVPTDLPTHGGMSRQSFSGLGHADMIGRKMLE